ncbi:MAG: putative Zn-dependent protease [Verrucomicrobiales bacterium]|jgi:predicted Zn-dependent protease
MKRFLPLAAALLTLGCLIPNCAVVPETGRRQLLSMSPEEETKLGLQAFQQYKQKKPISNNTALAARVRRVGQRLASVANVPGARWEFILFEDKEPNAFAVPGGKVGINTGIMIIAQTDAGLATIIGHEIAHLTARHAGERVSQKRVAQIGASVLGLVLPEAGLLTSGVGVGAQLGLLRFSRAHELEADQIGTLLMARAGYDPREAIGFWQRFANDKKQKGSGSKHEFLSTHPLDERRIQALRAHVPRAMAEYRG